VKPLRPTGPGRDPLQEVETQRDDLLVYLSAARAILDVCATGRGVHVTSQELAVVLVRELGVEACAIALRLMFSCSRYDASVFAMLAPLL